MPSFQFAGRLYRNSREMHAAIAAEWLSAGGANSRATMIEFLAEASDEQLAAEAEASWELADDENYDRGELAAAFARLRRDFDERFPE